jgi:hypothetical protein
MRPINEITKELYKDLELLPMDMDGMGENHFNTTLNI